MDDSPIRPSTGGFSERPQSPFVVDSGPGPEAGPNWVGAAIDAGVSRIGHGAKLATIVFAVLLFLGLAYKFVTYGTTHTYTVALTFAGREEDKYPNGTAFSITDIIAPDVVASVYTDNHLADQNIGYADFRNRLGISPFSVDVGAIMLSYDAVFDQRKATQSEIEQTQAAMNREIDRKSRSAVQLTFDNRHQNLSDELVAKILTDIVETWAQKAIKERGVVRTDIAAVRSEALDLDRLKGFERLNLLRGVRNRIDSLRGYIDTIGELPGGNVIVDEQSSLNINGLKARLNDVETQFRELPVEWSRNIVDNPEVQRLPVNLYSSKVMTDDAVRELDYLVAIDLAEERIGLIRKNIDLILAESFGGTTTDPVTGYTVYDIDRLLTELDAYDVSSLRSPVLELGLARNPQTVQLYYDARLRELERDRLLVGERASIVEKAAANADSLSLSAPGAPAPGGADSPPVSTVIPQFGEGFIDRLIQLSKQGDSADFRQAFMREAVDLQKQQTSIDSDIGKVRQYIAKLGSRGESQPGEYAEFKKRLDDNLPKVIDTLRSYADVTIRIAQRLRYARDIYAIVEDKEQKTVTGDYYLRDGVTATPQVDTINGSLRDISGIASRLNALIDSSSVGTSHALYRPMSNVEVIEPPVFGPILWIVILGGSVAAFLSIVSLAGISRIWQLWRGYNFGNA